MLWFGGVLFFVSLGALILFVATRTPLRSSKVGSDSSSRPSRETEGLSEISTTSEVPCHKSFQKWCPQQINYFGDKISGKPFIWSAPILGNCYIYSYYMLYLYISTTSLSLSASCFLTRSDTGKLYRLMEKVLEVSSNP